MLIYVKLIKMIFKKIFYFMLILCFSSDGRTDTRSTQNYSSEPHKKGV